MPLFQSDPFTLIPNFAEHDEELAGIAAAGYALLLHSNVWRSQFAYATYPAAWREAYHRHSLSMLDSILMWGGARIRGRAAGMKRPECTLQFPVFL